ncbi:metal-dependent hydrolase [Natronobiforma cellulositropha]|uniref:metal-dependent hydrolase n=1 Tax=Natronobiforma cellulositropha TaxID=1679076 RepID=UPI0021D5F389|nr:metal-dependent hydrolase [Natronobiforma cellulositropha]
MWPWEHAIVGYLVYSLVSRVVFREPPGGLEAFAVVFASVLPDLIDKPLAWEYGVFETGYALGHSIFFALPLAICVGLLARAAGRSRAGLAFGLGYLLHLPADVLHHYAVRGVVQWELMLWPVDSVPDTHGHGIVEGFSRLFSDYSAALLAGDLSTYMWLQVGLAVFTFLLWLADGAPVARDFVLAVKRLLVGALSGVGDGPQRSK